MSDLFNQPVEREPGKHIFSVSQLNREVRELLECHYGTIWLKGEISNFSKPSSGHFYFSLKDSKTSIRCAMFRNQNRYLRFQPKNGQQIVARGRLSLYEARGEFQFIAEHLEPVGEGDLQQKLEQTKQKLQQLGWFDSQHKKALPVFPQRIGVITSPTGAAIQDVLNVLSRRFPGASVMIYPALVQGQAAAEDIASMVRLASERSECDVLLLIRGGGSLEDLWAFNEEVVARAIYECELPIVSGVGHEVDFTIADMVADYRAPTPSAAAELVSPDAEALMRRVESLFERIRQALQQAVLHRKRSIQQYEIRLRNQHPERRLAQQTQASDELSARLQRAMENRIWSAAAVTAQLQQKCYRFSPEHRLMYLRTRLQNSEQGLDRGQSSLLKAHRTQLQLLMRTLDNVSPLATLERGYAVVSTYPEGDILRDAEQVAEGDQVMTRLAKGQLICTVNTRKT
ncbi:MAG: exodeoxyribonuclease VII large subunit [Gammaproteobacteria bacterium]|nr:exodeoxyribonuclease VII large subunit [Gammaproteobacteria bacterium]